jgi:hypothetical protein
LLQKEPELNELNAKRRVDTREGGVRTAYDAWLRTHGRQ